MYVSVCVCVCVHVEEVDENWKMLSFVRQELCAHHVEDSLDS